MLRSLLVAVLTLGPLSIAHAESAPVDGAWNPPLDTGVRDGGGGPAEQCHRIHAAGGCCLPNDIDHALPCRAGYAPADECLNVRSFCPMDSPDSGQLDAADAVETDAGSPADASGQSSNPSRAGELATTGSGCGCATAGHTTDTGSALLSIALGLLLCRRPRRARRSAP